MPFFGKNAAASRDLPLFPPSFPLPCFSFELEQMSDTLQAPSPSRQFSQVTWITVLALHRAVVGGKMWGQTQMCWFSLAVSKSTFIRNPWDPFTWKRPLR